MDLASINNEISGLLPSNQTLIVIALVSIGVALLYVSPSGKKFRERLSELMFSNWRLALLGATGIVLSLASGWTTWDGMRNFTREPLLSLMITFGIQGVMLIVAWLIGESFATGMNVRGDGKAGGSRRAIAALQPIAGTAIGILLFVAVSMLILNQVGDEAILATSAAPGTWSVLPNGLLLAAIAILLVATLIINAGSEIIGDYLQAIRVIVRSAVLWVMFLACMATSVFFSFDSLFSTIFPKEERVRAAELRAQNQIAGVVNDIGALATQRRLQERDRLFENAGWKQYDRTIDKLVATARQAPQALEEYFEKKMRERQRLVAQRQEEKSAAESQQVRLAQRVKVLNDEIARARSVVTQLTPVVEELKSKIFAKDREVVAKKAEAEAEAGGIGVTAKQGRGPKFREISSELRILREQKKNLQLQLGEYEKRLTAARTEISRNEAEQSTTLGELATLKGRAETADRLIEVAKQSGDSNAPAFDPTDGLRQLERARVAFRQDPSQTRLANIQSLCGSLVSAMGEVPTLKASAGAIDCDPGQANEAAARVFALNVGLQVLAANCIGGDKLPKSGGADALFGFARQCVQDAGLPSRDTDQLRTQINYLELNRDDKAHRFVVTSNAFQDGNKLAYLALAIAIAIDALVFMSGLFGANAVRSPLSDVPSHKGRSAQQLEAIIDTALQPHPYETARLVLGAMRPITPRDGFTAEIVVEDHDLHAADLRRVLNAGSSIGAVRHGDAHDRIYQVRSELFEYLSIAAKREYEKDKDRVNLAELERTVAVAMLPDVGANAELVLSYMHPIKERHGFMAEIKLSEASNSAEQKTMRSALNAGAVYERVQRVGDSAGHYFIHADFFKTLTALRGRLLMSGGHVAATALAQQERQPTATVTDQQARQLSDARMETNDEIRAEARRTLLDALGINREQYEECAKNIGVATAAEQSLQRLMEKTDTRFGYELETQLNQAWETIVRASDGLYARYNNVEGADKVIAEARRQIEALIPAMFLYPGGPYATVLDNIIMSLEQAAQSDDGLKPNEQDMLDRLRQHAAVFADAQNVDLAVRSVDNYLDGLDVPNVVRIGETTRHSA